MMGFTMEQREVLHNVMVAWRARYLDVLHARGSSQAAEDYAYGVAQYRLGMRKSLPQPSVMIGRDDKENRKLIRKQVDTLLAERET